MKLTELFEQAFLTEAARFTGREKAHVMREIDNFLIGIEYEFNVDDSWGAADVTTVTNKKMDIYSKVEYVRDNVTALVRAHTVIQSKPLTQLSENAKDVAAGVVDAFMPVDVKTAEVVCLYFLHILKQSKEILSAIPAAARVNGIGLARDAQPKDVMLINRVTKNAGKVLSNTNPMFVEMFAQDVVDAVSIIERHMAVSASHLKPTMTPVEMVEKVSSGIRTTIANRAIPKDTFTKIDFVKKHMPEHVEMSRIFDIVPDPSVPRGVEVITKPLSYSDAIETMKEMFAYISMVGDTSELTGMHVNISYKGKAFSNMNAVKALTLIDDYELTKGTVRSSGLRWAQRRVSGEPNHQIFLRKSPDSNMPYLIELAYTYNQKGADAFIKKYEDILIKQGQDQKFISFNLRSFFGGNTSERRVEWRVMGGKDYHKRKEEIEDDILRVCFVILAGMDESFLRREYLQSIVRMLNKIAKSVDENGYDFMDLIDLTRQRKALP